MNLNLESQPDEKKIKLIGYLLQNRLDGLSKINLGEENGLKLLTNILELRNKLPELDSLLTDCQNELVKSLFQVQQQIPEVPLEQQKNPEEQDLFPEG